MSIQRGVRTALAAVAGLTMAVALTFANASPASAHGYTNGPVSRQMQCSTGAVTNCGPIQYEPQSVEGLKGFPAAGPADGQICAGGNSGFAPLDNPRGGAWPAQTVQAGQQYTFSWKITAAHRTTKFEYFITNSSYNPLNPVTRATLEPTPFVTVNYGGAQPPFSYSHTGTLPTGKTGRHLIVAVWTVHDTANAFYACSDVVFGSSPGDPGPGDPDPGTCAGLPAWNSGSAYNGGAEVGHGGSKWSARWWTQGEEPGTTGQWGVWQQLGAC
ncbi:lytic polysaccharide monooxygenase [Phytomonospora sp. NPDC050363]|uniref:lytic polysaccharide monooxygenase n=1 Tax=Phytomonospora sp. NPDC050363 TaxID=3155642 RepID=UPI00340287DA